MRQDEADVKRAASTTTRLTMGSIEEERRERKDEEQGALRTLQNPYSQADSVARHNNTVVTILLAVKSNLRLMQTIENFTEPHRETRDRGET